MRENIGPILNRYLDYFPEEKESLEQLEDFIEQNKENQEAIYSSKNTVGHVTASGFLYDKRDKKLLLLKHKKLEKWLQPGGHSEKIDNSLLETAKREIFEETGLKNLDLVKWSGNDIIPFDINTHLIPKNPNKNMPAHYHHDFRFLFVVEKMEAIKIDEKESNGYIWANIDEIQDLENRERIIEKLKKILNE